MCVKYTELLLVPLIVSHRLMQHVLKQTDTIIMKVSLLRVLYVSFLLEQVNQSSILHPSHS